MLVLLVQLSLFVMLTRPFQVIIADTAPQANGSFAIHLKDSPGTTYNTPGESGITPPQVFCVQLLHHDWAVSGPLTGSNLFVLRAVTVTSGSLPSGD
jgi:hypothetical protein